MKRLRSRVVTSLVPITFVAGIASPAFSAAPGSVSGTVINGTTGGPIPAGLEISIAQLDGTRKEKSRKTVRTDSQGRFSADAFDRQDGDRFLIATTYLGVTYSKLTEASLTDEQVVEMKVFETIADSAAIQVTSDTMTVVRGDDDQMEILEVIRIENRSDRTYIGTPSETGEGLPQTVRLPLPPGAFDVSLSDTLSAKGVEASAEGLVTSEPVLPGETSYSYAYKIKAPRSGWQLRRPIVYPTSRIDLIIDDRLTTTAPGFDLQERPNLGGRIYRRYRSGPFQAGDILGADVGYPQDTTRTGLWAGLGAAVLLLMILGAATVRARTKPKPVTRTDRDELIRKIAELDAAFEEGEMQEAPYQSARQRLKKELIEATESVSAESR